MNRPNFQQIEDSPEKNYMRYVSLYRLDDLVKITIFGIHHGILMKKKNYNKNLLFQMDKLKLLNYERQLLKEMKMKPLGRYYFLSSINPGEQFFMFTSLCAFCVRKMGKDFEQPEEFMDPTVLVAKIIQILQELVKRLNSANLLKYYRRFNFYAEKVEIDDKN